MTRLGLCLNYTHMKTDETESEIELNFAVLKLKHTVKWKEKKQ